MYHIIFCLDENYISVLEYLLKTFKKTNNIKKFILNFVISDEKHFLHDKILNISSKISSDFTIRYKYYTPTKDFKKTLVEYGNLLFGDKEHIKKQSVYFNYANWSRFHIIDLFPDIKKGLYLDLDILFNSNIEEIFKINIDNHIVAISPYNKGNNSIIQKIRSLDKPQDVSKVDAFFKFLDINREDLNNQHYNCGVMYFNFELLRSNNIQSKVEKLLKYMIKNPKIKMSGTQNIQNVLIPNYKTFSIEYNFLIWRITNLRYKIVHFKGIKINEMIENVYYKHYYKTIMGIKN